MRLDAFQLLSAWTWSTEFDLKDSLAELQDEIEPFGFGDLAEDTNLFMKCCAAIVSGDAQLATIVSMKGPVVRQRYEEIRTGITGAIDFVRGELKLPSLSAVPYPAMLVPLARLFAKSDGTAYHPSPKQSAALRRWFWRASFNRRYSSGVGRAHTADIEGMIKLRSDENHELIPLASLPAEFFEQNRFAVGSVNSKIFIAMLAQNSPRSLLNGNNVDLNAVLQVLNRKEFHHIYPRKHLSDAGTSEKQINCLTNFCFVSSGDNKKISKKAPSEYVSMITTNKEVTLASNLIPADFSDDDYAKFRKTRAKMLSEFSVSLAKQ